jgi:hypothetical protein
MSYVSWNDRKEVSELIGKTLVSVTVNDAKDEIRFVTNGGATYLMWHDANCCESVDIESITGDLRDLIGTPILMAEEATSTENPVDAKPETIEYQDSFTWTFYKLATIKGYVDIRWYGSSNGYYSESVDFGLESSG